MSRRVDVDTFYKTTIRRAGATKAMPKIAVPQLEIAVKELAAPIGT